MICTVIDKDSDLTLLYSLNNAPIEDTKCQIEMAELRLESLTTPLEDLARLVQNSNIPVVATYRLPQKSSFKQAREGEKALCTMIEAGARYVDVELGYPKSVFKNIFLKAEEHGTSIIRSYHDFDGCGTKEELLKIVETCFYHDADVAKIAVTAKNEKDVKAIKELYSECAEGSLLAFSMGSDYSQTRLDCLALGAPFAYACPNPAQSATKEPQRRQAPTQANPLGQLPTTEMYQKIYATSCPTTRNYYNKTFTTSLPASKSCAQRAILLATLSKGASTLKGYTPCHDSENALKIAQEMGCKITRNANAPKSQEAHNNTKHAQEAKEQTLTITPPSKLTIPETLDVGESGFLARAIAPIVSALANQKTTITGEGTLANRKLKKLGENFKALNVEYADTDSHIPYTVKGPLKTAEHLILDGSQGSQQISGIMMALPLCNTDCQSATTPPHTPNRQTTLTIKNPVSTPYLFLTQEIMEAFGVKAKDAPQGFTIRLNENYKGTTYTIEKDWSAAAMYLIAGAIFGKASLNGLKADSLQADSKIVRILSEAGAIVKQTENETSVFRAPLNTIITDLTDCPDLFPVVSVLAAFCPGENELYGTKRLLHKESNRLESIKEMLAKLGVEHKEDEDVICITGHSLQSRLLNHNLLKGGNFSSHNDHRMVFALSLAALSTDKEIKIDDTSCVAKSFPEFKNLL